MKFYEVEVGQICRWEPKGGKPHLFVKTASNRTIELPGVKMVNVGAETPVELVTGRSESDSVASLTRQLAASSYPGHYISTACQRGKREHCRLADKWTGEKCVCECGHATGNTSPTYDELTRQLEEARREVAAMVRNLATALCPDSPIESAEAEFDLDAMGACQIIKRHRQQAKESLSLHAAIEAAPHAVLVEEPPKLSPACRMGQRSK